MPHGAGSADENGVGVAARSDSERVPDVGETSPTARPETVLVQWGGASESSA